MTAFKITVNGLRTAVNCLVLTAVFLFSATTDGRVLRVPDDYQTLQEAVYQAETRDTVAVGIGEFPGCQVTAGQGISSFVTILGSGWPNGTVITGFALNEQMNAIELRNTTGWRITNCEFTNCGDAVNVGGDFKFEFDHNYVHDLTLSYWPCAMEGLLAESRIHHNLIVGCYGGLMLWGRHGDPYGLLIYNNTMHNLDHEGVQFREGAPHHCTITNNLFFGFWGQAVEFAYCDQDQTTSITYNLVWETDGEWENATPGAGNIYESPQLVLANSIPEYYFLDQNSPCIDAGNPSAFYDDPDGSRSDIGAFPAGAQSIMVEIAWVEAAPGMTAVMPVSISHTTGASITNCEFIIDYPSTQLTAITIEIPEESPPDLAGWSADYTFQQGRIIIEMGGAVPLFDEGVLCNLIFTVHEDNDPYVPVPVNFESALLNEGALIPLMINGGIQPLLGELYGDVNLSGIVNLLDVDLLFDYLAGISDLTELQRRLADVTGLMGITAYDGALIIKYTQSLIDAFPVEGGNVDMFAAGRIDLEDGIAKAGETFTYPVHLVNGVNVSGAQLAVSLTGCPVQLTGIINPPEGVWFSRIGGTYPDYRIYLGGSGTLNGNTELCRLEFSIPHDAAGEEFELTCSAIMLNETEIAASSTGRITVVDSTEAASSNTVTHAYALHPSYPNPFNAETTLSFSLASLQPVNLSIYNALGQLVSVLETQTLPAGDYAYHWNAGQLSTGLYIAILSTPDFHAQQKIMLIK